MRIKSNFCMSVYCFQMNFRITYNHFNRLFKAVSCCTADFQNCLFYLSTRTKIIGNLIQMHQNT